METLLNDPNFLINIVLSVVVVMLVASHIIRDGRRDGSVSKEIAMRLAEMVPPELILKGALRVNDMVKSDSNPNNDWIGDVVLKGAQVAIDHVPVPDDPVTPDAEKAANDVTA